MADRKKKIWVRHRALNKDRVFLQRRVRRWWKLWLFPAFTDWKLMNQEGYDIDDKVATKLLEIQELLHKKADFEKFMAQQLKEINESTWQTRGYSEPFRLSVKIKELPIKKQVWGSPVPGDWKNKLAPWVLKKAGIQGGGRHGGGGHGESTREKVGAPDINLGDTTAYLPEELRGWKMVIDESGKYDHTMDFRPPQRSNKNKGKGSNQNNNNGNNDNRNDDFYR